MKKVLLILLLICSVLCFADERQDADSDLMEGYGYLKRTKGMSAGLERDKLLQAAKGKFETALEKYNEYIDKNPGKASELDSKLTQINSQIFWCNKLTTMAYYNAEGKKSETRKPEPVAKPEEKEQEKPAETETVAEVKEEKPVQKKSEETEKPVTASVSAVEDVKPFLDKVAGLALKRRFVDIDLLCRKAEKGTVSGVPPAFAAQVRMEVRYVNTFFSSVFDKLLNAKKDEIVHYRSEGGKTVKMTVQSIEEGLLNMNVQETGSARVTDMSLSVFSMDDAFLEKNIQIPTRDVFAGIGAFHLLQMNAARAKVFLNKAAAMKGELPLDSIIGRTDAILADQNKAVADRKDSKLRNDLAKYMKGAYDYYKRRNYDWALNNLQRIIDKGKKDPDYIRPVSDQCKELSGKPLPVFAKTLVEECKKCNEKRIVTCLQCKGKGKVKSLLGKARMITCPMCRGKKRINCPYCEKRLKSVRNKKIISSLEKILKK